MLVKLTARQISEWWPVVKECLERTLPPFTYASPERFANILEQLLQGGMQCWIVQRFDDSAQTVAPEGFVVTTISIDECSGVKNLLLYAVWSFGLVSDEEYRNGWQTLVTFARASGCHRIVTYTDQKRVVQQFQMLGGEAKYAFLTYEVPQ